MKLTVTNAANFGSNKVMDRTMSRARSAAKAMAEADDTDYFVAAGGNVSPDKGRTQVRPSELQLLVPLTQ